MEPEHGTWERTLVDLVRDVAANQLSEGTAEFTFISSAHDRAGRGLALSPANAHAASVRLYPDDELDYIEVGSHASLELWQPPAERLPLLRDLLRAVIDGRFSETVSYGPQGEPLDVRATFHLDKAPWEYVRSSPPQTPRWRYLLFSPKRSEATTRYESYAS